LVPVNASIRGEEEIVLKSILYEELIDSKKIPKRSKSQILKALKKSIPLNSRDENPKQELDALVFEIKKMV